MLPWMTFSSASNVPSCNPRSGPNSFCEVAVVRNFVVYNDADHVLADLQYALSWIHAPPAHKALERA